MSRPLVWPFVSWTFLGHRRRRRRRRCRRRQITNANSERRPDSSPLNSLTSCTSPIAANDPCLGWPTRSAPLISSTIFTPLSRWPRLACRPSAPSVAPLPFGAPQNDNHKQRQQRCPFINLSRSFNCPLACTVGLADATEAQTTHSDFCCIPGPNQSTLFLQIGRHSGWPLFVGRRTLEPNRPTNQLIIWINRLSSVHRRLTGRPLGSIGRQQRPRLGGTRAGSRLPANVMCAGQLIEAN